VVAELAVIPAIVPEVETPVLVSKKSAPLVEAETIFNLAAGAVVPIPTLPLSRIANLSAPLESSARKLSAVVVPEPVRVSLASGTVLPIPTLPPGRRARV